MVPKNLTFLYCKIYIVISEKRERRTLMFLIYLLNQKLNFLQVAIHLVREIELNIWSLISYWRK